MMIFSNPCQCCAHHVLSVYAYCELNSKDVPIFIYVRLNLLLQWQLLVTLFYISHFIEVNLPHLHPVFANKGGWGGGGGRWGKDLICILFW